MAKRALYSFTYEDFKPETFAAPFATDNRGDTQLPAGGVPLGAIKDELAQFLMRPNMAIYTSEGSDTYIDPERFCNHVHQWARAGFMLGLWIGLCGKLRQCEYPIDPIHPEWIVDEKDLDKPDNGKLFNFEALASAYTLDSHGPSFKASYCETLRGSGMTHDGCTRRLHNLRFTLKTFIDPVISESFQCGIAASACVFRANAPDATAELVRRKEMTARYAAAGLNGMVSIVNYA